MSTSERRHESQHYEPDIGLAAMQIGVAKAKRTLLTSFATTRWGNQSNTFVERELGLPG